MLKAGDEISPVFESPLGLFDPEQMGPVLEDKYGIPRRRLTGLMSPWAVKRLDEFGGDISKFRVVKLMPSRLRQIGRRQDRARRREQPGHLRPRRQGGHPQARDAQPERSRRLQLLRRPEPRDPGHPRIRRDVQGADQDAAPAADGDAGRQLCRHREHRRHSRSRASSWPTPTRRSGRPSRTTRTTKPSSTAST